MMLIPVLDVLLPGMGGRTPRTVAQSANSRNFLVTVGVVAACVVHGDTATAILEQSTWLVVVVTILVIARTVESLVQRRGVRHE